MSATIASNRVWSSAARASLVEAAVTGRAPHFSRITPRTSRPSSSAGSENSSRGASTGAGPAPSAPAFGALDRVRQHVPHDLLEPGAVAHHARAGAIHGAFEHDAAAGGCRPDRLGRRADHRIQVHGFALHGELAGRDA